MSCWSPARPAAVRGVGLVLLVVWVGLVGCHKKVKVVFERPPAVSSVPESEKMPPDQPEAGGESAGESSEPGEAAAPPEERPSPKPAPRRKPAPPPELAPPPEPPEPRLSGTEDSAEARAILEKLTRAEAILSTLQKRPLTREQREQVAAAQTFVAQARKAYTEGDYRRAGVLADKGLILAEDVRSSTRAGGP